MKDNVVEERMEQYRPYGKLLQRERFGYALGAIPCELLAYIFMFKYIELFFDDLKLAPAYFIIGQVIYLIINAINDPLMGTYIHYMVNVENKCKKH